MCIWPCLLPAYDGEAAPLDELGLDLDYVDLGIESEIALLQAEELVVSATRYSQPISQSPSAISLLTREQILASGYDNLPDLLRLIPGVDVFRISQAWAPVGIRTGMSALGDMLLVLVDGRDVALHLSGGPIWTLLPVDIREIERIEIIRGPGSAVYGANSLQGVVNIVTRSPDEHSFAFEPSGWIGGPRTMGGSMVAHGATSGGVGWWFSTGYDQRAPFDLPEERSQRTGRARARLDFSLVEDSKLSVEGGVVAGDGRYHLTVTEGPVTIASPYLMARLEHGKSTMTAIVEHSALTIEQDLGLVMPADADSHLSTLAVAPRIDLASRSLELMAHQDRRLLDNHRLVAGVTGRAIHHYDITLVSCPRDVTLETFDESLCPPAPLWELRGSLFAQDDWSITDSLNLTTGARIDVNNLHPEIGFSPRLTAVWSPLEGHSFRAGYGRSYRKPSFMETRLHFVVEPDPSVPSEMAQWLQYLFATQCGNPDLRNMKMDAIEAGWRGRLLDDRITISVDGFISLTRAAIIAEMDGLTPQVGMGGVPQVPTDAFIGWNNVDGEIWGAGGEIELSYRPSRLLELSASYALDKKRVVDFPESELSLQDEGSEPTHRLIGSLRLKLLDGLSAGMDAFWASRYSATIRDPDSVLDTPITQHLGDHTLLHATCQYERAVRDMPLEISLSLLLPATGSPKEFAGGPRTESGQLFGARPMTPRLIARVGGRF